MKKLPSIYKNDIKKITDHNEKVYYCSKENLKNNNIQENKNIEEEINSIFKSISPSYSIDLIIKTNTKDYETSIINRYHNKILTIDNDIINISDIVSITRKNP